MNDRDCLRTSTNVWRSLCDHCELRANCIRKPIRHTFATGETSIIFETPHERTRLLTNTYECLAIICDHYELMANCIRKPIRHIFATVRTSMIFATPHERTRLLTNTYECLAIICDHYELMANCIRKPIRHTFATGETCISVTCVLSPMITVWHGALRYRISTSSMRNIL